MSLTGLTTFAAIFEFAPVVIIVVPVLLVLFFVVHIIMVLLAGPLNELRSMITGWYRTSPGTPREQGDKP